MTGLPFVTNSVHNLHGQNFLVQPRAGRGLVWGPQYYVPAFCRRGPSGLIMLRPPALTHWTSSEQCVEASGISISLGSCSIPHFYYVPLFIAVWTKRKTAESPSDLLTLRLHVFMGKEMHLTPLLELKVDKLNTTKPAFFICIQLHREPLRLCLFPVCSVCHALINQARDLLNIYDQQGIQDVIYDM